MIYRKPAITETGDAMKVIQGTKPNQFSTTDAPFFRPENGGIYDTEE